MDVTGRYAHLHRTSSALYANYFTYPTTSHAPSRYLSLGREISRLSESLERLPAISGPAALEALAIAFQDAEESLRSVQGCLVREGGDEKWWMAYAIHIGESGEERRLVEAAERLGYHSWAFDVMMRVLRPGDAEDVIRRIRPLAVNVQLRKLLYVYVSEHIEDPIISRFDRLWRKGGIWTAETAVRVFMFWAYKAIRGLGYVQDTKQVPTAGYVNLLKAVWLLQRIRQSPHSNPEAVETKAAVALVSAELLATFKTILKAGMMFPGINAVLIHGDFRMFPDNFTECPQREPEVEDENEAHEKAILETLEDMSSLHCSSPPPPAYSSISSPIHSPPPSIASSCSPAPSIVSPRSPLPRRFSSVRMETRPVSLHIHTEENIVSPIRRTSRIERKRLPTPPSSIASIDEGPFEYQQYLQSRRTTRASSMDEEAPFEYHDYLEQTRSPSPTPSSVISEIYADSPTLGRRDSFAPVRVAPLKIQPSPLGSQTSLPVDVVPPSSTSSTWSELEVARLSMHGGGGGGGRPVRRKRLSVSQVSEHRAPSPSGLIPIEYDNGSLIPVETETLTEEYGVRPGEKEIMPYFFGELNVQASDTGTTFGSWDQALVRVFQNEMSGQYRILTIRGRHIDQRNIPPQSAELIPEYAYHENRPVIYLRSAGPGMYSLQTGSKGNRKSSKSGDAPPASSYYKFSSLYDMFTFQQAFLGETVESDVRNTRSIRYTRGFRDGEHTYSRARVQLWKEPPPAKPPMEAVHSSDRSRERAGYITSSTRARSAVEAIVRPTRLVMYLDYIAMCLFITDDVSVGIPSSHPKTLKLRPSSHRAFSNPSHVKACVLGNRNMSGGFRLDKEGLGIDVQEVFDDVKWFEIDFSSEAECRAFHQDISVALQQRRKERRLAEELKRQAALGVRAGEGMRQNTGESSGTSWPSV